MKSEIDLDAYFKRIGYESPRTTSLEVLKELHLLHPKTFPFENLNPYLRIPVKLDMEDFCLESGLNLMKSLKKE